MYDVGQGNSIKEGSGKVFSIKLKEYIPDIVYPCPVEDPDASKLPVQIPLGDMKYKSLVESYEKEDYEPTTQHTNAGEISDMGLLIIISVVCIVLLYLIFKK